MAERFEQGYAVVIGAGGDLPVTVADALAVADLLRDPTRCAYPPEQVRVLVDGEARRVALVEALDWLSQAAGPEATALVYFSGHGIESPDYYLLPHGYQLGDLEHTALAGALFTTQLRSVRARKLLVLLDCCHAGGLAEAKAPGMGLVTKAPLPPSLGETLGRGHGRVVIASSRRDEVSFTGHPYSIFTNAVLEALAGQGAFELDGYARVLDLALWVGRQVPERTCDRQHPIVKVSYLEENYALAYYAGGEKQPRPLEWAEATPRPTHAVSSHTAARHATWRRTLANYRENLLLIEERMSEYVEFTAIPLQLIKAKRQTEIRIAELEQKLGL